MRKITLADRLRYRFDNTISRGTVALIGWLFVLLAALVFASSLVVYATGVAPEAGGRRLGFLETLWLSLMRTIDPGGVGGDQGSWPFLLSMLVVANESRPSACVAVLAPKDKVEMEDEIRDRVGKTKNTRVICRTGDPIDIDDLELVNPHEARSIIALPPEGEDADSRVMKTILALTNNPNRRKEPYHIVSRMREPENLGVAQMVGGAEVELVPVDDLIARITAQTCRQSGLSVVYTDLLDFGGHEILLRPGAPPRREDLWRGPRGLRELLGDWAAREQRPHRAEPAGGLRGFRRGRAGAHSRGRQHHLALRERRLRD